MGKEPNRRHAKDMQNVIKRYYVDYFQNKCLNQIDELILQDFLVYLKIEKKLAASTVNQARNASFVALRYAKRRKLIKNFDFDAILRASGKTKQRGILEREEVEQLFNLEWRDCRSRLINLIASQTGMRMGEIRALRVCDILKDRINIQHSWSLVDGGLKSTKNKEKRQVPILSELHKEIKQYIKEKQKLFKLDSLLFPSMTNLNAPYDEKQIVEDFYTMMRKIGISDKERKERNIVFHSWRHYCAKNLAQVTNRNIGMAILGHKTSTVFDHYADHIDNETFNIMKDAIEKGLKIENENIEHLQFPKLVNG